MREVVTDDPRIDRDHTDVTQQRGFGGHCLPKDTKALVKTAKKQKVDLSLIEQAIEYNEKTRKE